MWPEHPVHAGGKVNWGHLAAADPSFGGTDGKYDLVEEFLPGPPPRPPHMQPGLGLGPSESAPGATGVPQTFLSCAGSSLNAWNSHPPCTAASPAGSWPLRRIRSWLKSF